MLLPYTVTRALVSCPNLLRVADDSLVNVTFQIRSQAQQQWWGVQESYFNELNEPATRDHLKLVSFNDRVAPQAFQFFTNYG